MNAQAVPFTTYLDSSMLACYKACPQKFWRTYLQHWKPRGQSVHLVAGKAFARGLEVSRKCFYEGQYEIEVTGKKAMVAAPKGDSEHAISEGLKALSLAYGDFACPADSAKSLERMMGAFEYYWDHYPLHEDVGNSPLQMASGKRAIEFSFAEPLDVRHPETGDPLLYVGRMDAIYGYAGGAYIVDEKTTTQLGASWGRQWDLRGQFTGYGWGCGKAGLRVDGAIIRGVSILKTKYETQQAVTYRPEWQIERWYNETCMWVEMMVRDWKENYFLHNFSDSCSSYGNCAFTRVCTSETPDPWLEADFEKRVWDPVLHTETILLPNQPTV
jgi:hypothetical protein